MTKMEDYYKKKYENAFKKAKDLHDNHALGMPFIYETCEQIFPELKESEDEKIGKAVKEAVEHYWSDVTRSRTDIFAWLEKQGEQPNKVSMWKHWKDGIAGNGEGKLVYLVKNGSTYRLSSCLGFECDYIELSELDKLLSQKKQGEQKPTDKVEPKFHEGDWIIDNKQINCINYIMRINKVGLTNYQCQYNNGLASYHFDFVDKNYHLWTIQDAKDGDVLAKKDIVFIFKHMDKTGLSLCKSYCEVVGNSKLGLGFDFSINGVQPATKEQYDLLFQKMKEAGYKWDAEKKELKKIEQEETEQNIDNKKLRDIVIEELNKYNGNENYKAPWALDSTGVKYPFHFAKLGAKWQKEQKPAWSEEDEKMIHFMIEYLERLNRPTGNSCIKWLKSLKEKMKGE